MATSKTPLPRIESAPAEPEATASSVSAPTVTAPRPVVDAGPAVAAEATPKPAPKAPSISVETQVDEPMQYEPAAQQYETAAQAQGSYEPAAQPASSAQPASAAQPQPAPMQAESNQASTKTSGGLGKGIFAWVHRTFPGHEHAFWGAVIGLLIALLVFAIGIFRALFILLLIAVGCAIGMILDGDNRIIDFVRRYTGDGRN